MPFVWVTFGKPVVVAGYGDVDDVSLLKTRKKDL